MANEKNVSTNPISDNDLYDAFQIDKQFTDYLEKVENGTLTPEEKALRKELREFMGFKD